MKLKHYPLRNLIFIVGLALLAGCNADPAETVDRVDRSSEMKPDQSYLLLEVDGKYYDYYEGDEGVEITNRAASSTIFSEIGYGAGFSLKDGSDWSMYFYFNPEDIKSNKDNKLKLFDTKPYDFIKQNRAYDFINTKGVQIENTKMIAPQTGRSIGTQYQENESPQLFQVTKVYPSPSYENFVFVEGNFDCWIGDFELKKNIKGKFRLEVACWTPN